MYLLIILHTWLTDFNMHHKKRELFFCALDNFKFYSEFPLYLGEWQTTIWELFILANSQVSAGQDYICSGFLR